MCVCGQVSVLGILHLATNRYAGGLFLAKLLLLLLLFFPPVYSSIPFFLQLQSTLDVVVFVVSFII